MALTDPEAIIWQPTFDDSNELPPHLAEAEDRFILFAEQFTETDNPPLHTRVEVRSVLDEEINPLRYAFNNDRSIAGDIAEITADRTVGVIDAATGLKRYKAARNSVAAMRTVNRVNRFGELRAGAQMTSVFLKSIGRRDDIVDATKAVTERQAETVDHSIWRIADGLTMGLQRHKDNPSEWRKLQTRADDMHTIIDRILKSGDADATRMLISVLVHNEKAREKYWGGLEKRFLAAAYRIGHIARN